MGSITVFDDKRRLTLIFKIGLNNRISRRYLSTGFPGMSGLYYENADGRFLMVEIDENDNFFAEWNTEIIYKPLYPDSRRSSRSSTSWTTRFLNGLIGAGVIISIWFGSVIASLWANIYEETLKKISIFMPFIASKSSSEPTMLLSVRIAILMIFSIIYLVLAVMITPRAITRWWGVFKSWLLGIDVASLTYNALFQPRLPPSPPSPPSPEQLQ